MAQTQDNTGLYFIVGALCVVVIIIGFLFINGNPNELNPGNVITQSEPAAGDTDTTENNFNLRVDEDGVSGTSSTRTTD